MFGVEEKGDAEDKQGEWSGDNGHYGGSCAPTLILVVFFALVIELLGVEKGA